MAGERRWRLRLMNWWPPFAGAGVRARVIRRDPLAFESRLALRWWNRNYVGTHFGGSLYAMTDPFYMLILVEELGAGFVVWDKSARIRYLRPGRGTVSARFEIARERIEQIRSEAAERGRLEVELGVEVLDEAGQVVAEVEKRLSVRRRDPAG